jgi:hypothetical protein
MLRGGGDVVMALLIEDLAPSPLRGEVLALREDAV